MQGLVLLSRLRGAEVWPWMCCQWSGWVLRDETPFSCHWIANLPAQNLPPHRGPHKLSSCTRKGSQDALGDIFLSRALFDLLVVPQMHEP